MLFGRDVECARIDALLHAARERRSDALVLRGEAGIGKSALLEYAVERAEGFRVLRALGVESEAEIAFAGAQQLLRPVMGALTELPAPQASAIRRALAIEEGLAPEPLTVSVATLSLLAAAADDRPLVCVVDDAHWLDQASAEVLTFAARRLYAEGVAMLFAAREPETVLFPAPGVRRAPRSRPHLGGRASAARRAGAGTRRAHGRATDRIGLGKPARAGRNFSRAERAATPGSRTGRAAPPCRY